MGTVGYFAVHALEIAGGPQSIDYFPSQAKPKRSPLVSFFFVIRSAILQHRRTVSWGFHVIEWFVVEAVRQELKTGKYSCSAEHPVRIFFPNAYGGSPSKVPNFGKT